MNWTRTLFILFIIFISSTIEVEAQKTIESKKKKVDEEAKEPYLFVGGSLWLGFGNTSYVDVNFLFGSQLTQRLSIGLSGKYQYYNQKGSVSNNFSEFKNHVYGGSIFSQFALIKDFRNIIKVKGHSGIIVHAEYEFLNTAYNYVYFKDINADRSRYWLHNILVGGGYFQQMGKRSKSYIVLLWNLHDSDQNPYIYPQFRIGFTVGI